MDCKALITNLKASDALRSSVAREIRDEAIRRAQVNPADPLYQAWCLLGHSNALAIVSLELAAESDT